jgi:hypothetical protein
MEILTHDLPALFLQLGLDNSSSAIDLFIEQHSQLESNYLLHEARFWNTSQANFLKESVDNDADWVDAVNHLDVLLRPVKT